MHKLCASREEIQIYLSTEVLPDSWDALLPAQHPMRKQELALYESIQLSDVHAYYALWGDPDKPKAIAYFQTLQLLPKHLNSRLLEGFMAKMAPFCLGLFKPSLLIAGHLFRHDIDTFYAHSSLSKLDAFRAYEKMIQAVAKKASVMATLVKDLPHEYVPYFQNFAPHYWPLRNDISMEMNLPKNWQSFADYESTLKHKYAQKLRKVRSSLRPLVVVELDQSEVFERAETLFQLYKQVSQHQNISLGFLNAQFLPQLKKRYPEKLKIWAFYEGHKMLAFASAWVHDQCFDMFYIGFDYERNAQYNLYFNILYFSVEQALLLGKGKLNLGRTALEAKARLGCTPRYLPTFLHIRNACLKTLVNGRINAQYQQEGAWEERHPFRETKDSSVKKQ